MLANSSMSAPLPNAESPAPVIAMQRRAVSVDRPRLLHRPVDRLERLPAALGQDLRQPEFARHPGRHFAAGPQAAVGRWLGQARAQALQKPGPEHARYASVAPAQIAQRIRTFRVVASEQLLNPARDEARQRRDIRDRVTPR